MFGYQVTLFKLDRNHDVRRRDQREYRVRDSHRRGAPEHNYPTHIQRMPDDVIEQGSGESQVRLSLPLQMSPDLPHSETGQNG